MSFGFSVGDFIAGANLAYRLLRTLSDSQGSSTEYQEVIQELGCVQQTFLHVEHMRSCNLFSKATMNAISYIINSSVDVMSKFFARTEKYRRSLSSNGGQSLDMDSWQKVGWSLFRKEELRGLRDTLQTRLTAIAILVNTASHQNQFIIPKEVAKFQTSGFEYRTSQQASDSWSTTTAAGENGIQELTGETLDDGADRRQLAEQDAIKALTALYLLQPARLPPPEQEETVYFKDAVGRKFSFPFHLCCTWQGMEELIRQAFLHVDVVGPHVAEGHYDLVSPNGDIILPEVWETVIEPDWTVTMHMWPIPEKPKPSAPEPGPQPDSIQECLSFSQKYFDTSKLADLSRRLRDMDRKRTAGHR